MDRDSVLVQLNYSGGIFQHVPFQGKLWVSELIKAGFSQPPTVCMLILVIILLFGLFAVLFHTLLNCGDREDKAKFPEADDLSSIEPIHSDSSDSIFLSVVSNKLSTTPFMLDQPEEWSNQTEISTLNSLDHGRQIVENVDREASPLSAVLGIHEESKRKRPKQLRLKNHISTAFSKHNPAIHSSQHIKRFVNKRWRTMGYAILSISSLLCLMGYVISITVAMQSQREIVKFIELLPHLSNSLTKRVSQFGNFSLDILFNLTCVHITDDSSRADNSSHLQKLVTHVEQLVSEALACLIHRCADSALGLPVLFAQTDVELVFSNSLLSAFQLAIERVNRLNQAGSLLTSAFIHNVTRCWYMYQRELWTITSTTVMPDASTDKSYGFSNYPWFNRTETVICEHLNRNKTLRQFENCQQVSSFLQDVLNYITKVPFMLPPKSLETVVRFTFIPKALGVQEIFEQWLPVLTDLPGQGAKFLLKTFLPAEINRTKIQMSDKLASILSKNASDKIISYGHMFDSALTIVFTLLVIFGLLSSVLCITLLFRCVRKEKHISDFRSEEPVKSLICTKFRVMRCSTVISAFVIFFCFGLSIIGTGLVFMSSLVRSELCIYVFKGEAQHVADVVLTNRLSTTLHNLPVAREFIRIPNLDLHIPYPILHTINTEYAPGQPSLLHSLHMDKPVNLTALLNSAWFNRTLHSAWETDVRQKLLKTDVSRKIPKLSLVDIFNQAKKTTKLEDSFDNLPVGKVDEYLNDPGEPYFDVLSEALDEINTEKASHLALTYNRIKLLQEDYSDKYHTVSRTLKIIEDNKNIIELISSLVSNASVALNNLNAMSTRNIVHLLDQVLTVGWPRFIPTANHELVPFVLNLLNDFIPFPELSAIYQEVVGPICPGSPNQLQTSAPINPEIGRLGTGLFASALFLIFAAVICAYSL